MRATLRAGGPLDQRIDQMVGLTRIDSFVVDSQHRDCLLLGHADGRFPELRLDDFVTALRNVWTSQDDPACSIDPEQANLAAIQRLFGQVDRAKSIEQISATFGEVVSVCKRPHRVKVYGVPFRSGFAHGMVGADYYMKQVAGGTAPHPAGLQSFRDLGYEWMLAEARRACGGPLPQLSVLARFWFYPRTPQYEEARDFFLIRSLGVQLLTEEEHLGASGQRIQARHPHPVADHFAKAFGEHYREAARRLAVYAHLRSLYRFVALALFMNRRAVFDRTGLDLALWLRGYTPPPVEVPNQVQGVAVLKQETFTCTAPQGLMTGPLWMPMCGGVLIPRSALAGGARIGAEAEVTAFVRRVLDAEPTPGRTLAWDVPAEKVGLEEF